MKSRLTAAPRCERVVLTGFMGCGKTTVGRALAVRLGWGFADLDERVAEQFGASVPEIFEQHGEAFFRALEREALHGLLAEFRLVIALGGGAVETPALRQALVADCETRIVHLDPPFDVLFERCTRQAMEPAATARPLLGSREAAQERHQRRQGLYASVRHVRVEAATPDPDAVAEAVLEALELQVPER